MPPQPADPSTKRNCKNCQVTYAHWLSRSRVRPMRNGMVAKRIDAISRTSNERESEYRAALTGGAECLLDSAMIATTRFIDVHSGSFEVSRKKAR
jgi:hypothetical protein